jgi:F-type H+-transporting ATPase subunit alpha
MKQVSGTLKLDQAQFRELEAFAKFGSDLDTATKLVIDKGARNVEILKQPQNSPLSVEKQIAIIYLGTKNLLRTVPVNKVREFETAFLQELEQRYPNDLKSLKTAKPKTDEWNRLMNLLEKVGGELAKQYK